MNTACRLLLVLSIYLLSLGQLQADEDWSDLYPLHLGDHWQYDVNYKGRQIKGSIDVIRSYEKEGREYFVMHSDEHDVEYHIAVDEKGVYLRCWRYPLPILKFIMCTIKFDPPIVIIDYPLEVGKRWVYIGRGSVWFMGRDVAISYEVKEKGVINLAFGDAHYFKVSGLIDDSKNLYEEVYYYGRGYGYIKGRGPERRDILVDYRPNSKCRQQQKD